jgi:hypothetical protein
MESNIYDLIISELILKDSSSGGTSISGSNSPKLTITSTAPKNQIVVNTNTSVTFTSTLTNMPDGYSVKPNTHILDFDLGSYGTSTGSGEILTVTKSAVLITSVSDYYMVDGSITLQKSGQPDIIVTASFSITAALPLFYGVKAYSTTPNFSGLLAINSNTREFTLTSSNLGRIYIVMPSTLTLVTLVDPSGLIIPVSDFELNIVGQQFNGVNYKYYMLKWDTQLTGTNNKLFKLNLI